MYVLEGGTTPEHQNYAFENIDRLNIWGDM